MTPSQAQMRPNTTQWADLANVAQLPSLHWFSHCPPSPSGSMMDLSAQSFALDPLYGPSRPIHRRHRHSISGTMRPNLSDFTNQSFTSSSSQRTYSRMSMPTLDSLLDNDYTATSFHQQQHIYPGMKQCSTDPNLSRKQTPNSSKRPFSSLDSSPESRLKRLTLDPVLPDAKPPVFFNDFDCISIDC
jgi:hypothetical protein